MGNNNWKLLPKKKREKTKWGKINNPKRRKAKQKPEKTEGGKKKKNQTEKNQTKAAFSSQPRFLVTRPKLCLFTELHSVATIKIFTDLAPFEQHFVEPLSNSVMQSGKWISSYFHAIKLETGTWLAKGYVMLKRGWQTWQRWSNNSLSVWENFTIKSNR